MSVEVNLPLAAMRRLARDLEGSYSPRRCDAEDSSSCSRCSVTALARWALRLTDALPEDAFVGVERTLTVSVAPAPWLADMEGDTTDE